MATSLLPALAVFAFPLALGAQSAGMVFDQPTTGDRLVVMEAENASGNVAAGGHTWTLTNAGTTPAGSADFVGTGSMVVLPNDNLLGNDNATTYPNGPRLNFRVLFRTTGTHYVWVRGRARDDTAATPSQPVGNNDSCHVALDGVATPTGYQLTGFVATEWRWIRTRKDGNASVNVATTGIHQLNLVMREDGLQVDRVLITTNAAYAPNPVTTAGPAQTGQVADTIPDAPDLSGSQVPAGIALSWTAETNASSYTLEKAPPTGDTWTLVTTQPGTTYTDKAVIQAQTYRYRVFSRKDAINLAVGPSNVVTIQPGDPLPRTDDSNEEGLFGDNCALGAAGAAPAGVAALAALALLAAARRRRVH